MRRRQRESIRGVKRRLRWEEGRDGQSRDGWHRSRDVVIVFVVGGGDLRRHVGGIKGRRWERGWRR